MTKCYLRFVAHNGHRGAFLPCYTPILLQGRNGLGNIYVWASGDGGEDDDCNCDGYAASMWTISINSAINDGQNAHYDESCTSTLASTFSNGGGDPKTGVATTDLYGRCTKTHSGTSAAAPEAAGVFALAIEVKWANDHLNLQRSLIKFKTDNLLAWKLKLWGREGSCREHKITMIEFSQCVSKFRKSVFDVGALFLQLRTKTLRI